MNFPLGGACHILLAVAMTASGFVSAQQAPPPELPPSASAQAPVTPSRFTPLADKPDWRKLETFSDVLTRQEFDEALKNIYLETGVTSSLPWQEDDEAVSVQDGPGASPIPIKFRATPAPDAEVPRYWRRARELPPLKAGEGVLTGLHVALDPGHIGGAYAVMEERWLQMGGAPGAVVEGDLVRAVAHYVKPRLEALGALVTFVREQQAPVTTAKPEDLKPVARQVLAEAGIAQPREDYNGVTGDAKMLTVQWQAEKLFYRVSEIRARAKRVNEELKPDIVICLHLNAEAWGDPAKPSFVDKDHFHLLINGCYSAGELKYEDVRFEMLQRLFTRTHTEEMALGDVMATAMAEATGLPPFVYPGHNARRVSANPYVWSRNLLANRIYQCPVIYLEPYVMNNEETYRRLLLGEFIGRTLLNGKLVTSPLEDYMRGIVNGLTAYYSAARTVK